MMKKYLSIIVIATLVLSSCVKDKIVVIEEDSSVEEDVTEEEDTGPFIGLNVPVNFSYSTSKKVDIALKVPDFLKGAAFTLYTTQQDTDSLKIATASFNENGDYNSEFSVPANIDSIMVLSNYIGLTHKVMVGIDNGVAYFDYRPFYERTAESGKSNKSSKASFIKADYSFLDSFNSLGVPNNLVFPDVIDQSLLDDLSASLPNKRLTDTHPEYIAGAETNIVLVAQADVWVTFVSEGAGWRNALGYYSYPIGQKPTSPSQIAEHHIIFPNASMQGSGGGLLPGDRVHLGSFPANTVVSWFLVANGWNGSGVGNGNGVHYSQPELNLETDENLKRHMVLLNDAGRNLNILAFEDIPRDWSSCDQDFNDAVFYAQANPITAIQTNSLASIDTSNDSDGDGINDDLDNFPFDPNIAFDNFYPSESSNGTLAYEDLWPSTGDYDFNDLVVDYQFNLLANAANKITKIEADFEIKNIGGAFHNGLAIVLPIAPSNIESVENQLLNADYITTAVNGTETGTGAEESVIFIVGDAYTQEGNTIAITINLNTPIEKSDLGNVPFNPFLIVNGDRTKEVHLPDFKPTSKASHLGEKDDYSSVQDNRYYKTNKNLPWALNIYDGFIPSPERIPINITYPRFIPWANSGGSTAHNWYVE